MAVSRKFDFLFKFFVFIFFNIVFLSNACGQDKFPLKIQDSTGREFIFKSPPKRIISLSPSITEILFYLGLSEKIVALTDLCDYPPEALSKPRIGDVNLNLEKLLEFQPDLVLAESGFFSNLGNEIDKFGIPLLYLQAKDMESISSSILIIGKVTGEVKVSQQLSETFNCEVEKINKKTSLIAVENRMKVFIEIWDDPLMTVGNKSFINNIVNISGGLNIAGNMDNNIVQVSSEWFVQEDPEVIIITNPGNKPKFLSKAIWSNVSSIKNGKIYEIDPDIVVRPTPRVIIGIRKIARWLYPCNDF